MPDHHARQHTAEPTVEQDLAVVEWLHCAGELPGEATGYLCDALLLWTLLGGDWPEPVPPALHPAEDLVEALAQLHARWLQRTLVEPIGRRLELATVGRLFGAAVRCARDIRTPNDLGGRLKPPPQGRTQVDRGMP